jgi:CRISPR-associated protein Cst1
MTPANRDWLTRRTGDPFADTGSWVIDWFWKNEEHADKDILGLIELVTKTYVNDWKGGLHSFFLNSTITNAANKGKEISETIKYFKGLLEETEVSQLGYCRILGEHTQLFSAGRQNSLMSGSLAFLNFHHGFQSGLMLSKEIIIRLFFVPYGTQVIGGYNAVLSVNNPLLEKRYVNRICNLNNLRTASRDTEGGVLKSEYSRPSNALFDFAVDCFVRVRDNELVEFNLCHYTNFAAKPESSLYCFSSLLFDFYRKVIQDKTKQDWNRFANSFFRKKGAIYNSESDEYEITEKKQVNKSDFAIFKHWYNPIYEKLLESKSILGDLKDWSYKQLRAQKNFTIFPIVKLYQKILFDMKEETLQKIEAIADFVVNDEKKKNLLTELRKAKHESQVRSFLLNLIRKKYEQKSTEPLVTLKEYVEVLFPDGTYGATIRDLLLISIYEKLSTKGEFSEDGSDDDSNS